jgi:hypothetical protein
MKIKLMNMLNPIAKIDQGKAKEIFVNRKIGSMAKLSNKSIRIW